MVGDPDGAPSGKSNANFHREKLPRAGLYRTDLTGLSATARVTSTMAHPTAKTIHFVTAGSTQIEPTIGEAAMSNANRYSPGDVVKAGRTRVRLAATA